MKSDDDVLREYQDEARARFFEFHRANPQVFREVKRMAREIKSTGRSEYGIRTIIEVMRWNYDLQTIGDVFKINSNFIPMYVRLLIARYPEFDGFFELRAVKGWGRFSDEERLRRAAVGLNADEDEDDWA